MLGFLITNFKYGQISFFYTFTQHKVFIEDDTKCCVSAVMALPLVFISEVGNMWMAVVIISLLPDLHILWHG